MYQTKWGYYADFVVYPIAVLVLTGVVFGSPHSRFLAVYFLCFLSGLAAWTLLEYFIHRFLFHALSPIAQMHDRHHANPGEFVGTPSWLSLPVFVLGILIPLRAIAGLEVATGLVAGLMIGLVCYAGLHDAIHRWPITRGSLLYKAKLRHAGHHAGRHGNFGVTTGFWDRVLGTVIAREEAR